MKVTVVCFGALRDHLPDPSINSAVLELHDEAVAGDVAEAFGIQVRRLHVVLVDGDQAGPSTPLREGSEVTLMPAFSGGAVTHEEQR